MELNYLRVFFEVAKLGCFTDTARNLHISQSALSRSVALLEESEGVKLFERSKSGVTLTPIGTEVFKHCEQLFQTVSKIEDVCRGTRETCEGPLRFTSADHVANYLLSEPLRTFQQRFPRVTPGILVRTPDETVASLLGGEGEFGLLFAKVASPQITYEGLREEPMVLVVRSDIWKESKSANQAGTLNKVLDKVGYISSVDANVHTRSSRVLLELFGKIPRVGIETSSQETQKRICLSGGGVAYLTRFVVEREIKDGLLHEIPVESPHVFKLWLAIRKGRVLSPAARMFLEHLKKSWN